MAVVVSQSNGPFACSRTATSSFASLRCARPRHEMARRRDRARAGMSRGIRQSERIARFRASFSFGEAGDAPNEDKNGQMTSPTARLVEPLCDSCTAGRFRAGPQPPAAQDDLGLAPRGLVMVADGVGGFDVCGPPYAMSPAEKLLTRLKSFHGDTALAGGMPI